MRMISRAALMSALLAVAAPVAVAGAGDATISVKVSGLRNMKGKVQICLTANPKAWPDCSKDRNAYKRTVTATAAANVEFAGIAPGTYALSLIHDENGNGKLDTAVMIPKEGFGFSRNPTITFGPPKFKTAQFAVGSIDVSQSVKMKYMF